MTTATMQPVPPSGVRLWIAGARPRTLGLSIAPVVVGSSIGVAYADRLIVWRALAALAVAVALQVGTNFANDYSDGVRGTDRDRVGPLRLTASGLVPAGAVRRAACIAFLLAAVVGVTLSLAVEPWLLALGVPVLLAGPLYTGGPRPYGYAALGELSVLLFFGFAATVGSTYVQLERVPGEAWWASVALGLLACAVLVVNNLRDVDVDRLASKRTLAVVLGRARTRWLFVGCVAGAFGAVVVLGTMRPLALMGLAAALFAVAPVRTVLVRRDAPALVAALVATVRVDLVVSALVAGGLCLS